MLGATSIFRTGADIARDIERFGEETKAFTTQPGNLLQMETAYKYSATRGRLATLEAEARAIEQELLSYQDAINLRARRLEELGVGNWQDYTLSTISAALSFVVPGISFIFGMFDSKKKKIKAIIREIETIVAAMRPVKERYDRVLAEAEQVGRALDAGPQSVEVKLLAPLPTTVKTTIGIDQTGYVRRTEKVVPKETFQYADAQAKRETVTIATQLPEGFQTLYSPAFSSPSKAIVTKTPLAAAQPKGALVTGQRLVYGGLSGPPSPGSVMMAALMGMAWFAFIVARQPTPGRR